jgi:hypothetical protein
MVSMKNTTELLAKSNFKTLIVLVVMLSFSILLILIQGCFKDIIIPLGNDDFAASLTTDKKYYKVGEQVELTLVLQNITGRTNDLMFNDGQTYDFIVKKVSDEKEVWRWSEGKSFTEAIWTMVLDSWERKTSTLTWDQKDNESKQVEPGIYKIEALISSEPEIFAIPMKIVIENPEAEIKFDTIDKGTQSGYNRRASIVIKDQNKWEEIWNLHTSNLDQIPRIPKVDFNTEMVIAIFRGEFTSSGFDTEVTRVIEKNGKIEVIVTETDNLNGMALDVMTYPFHIIKIKRSDLIVEFDYRRVIK